MVSRQHLQRLAVAYHEAGHAVAHLALKRGMVEFVTIVSAEGYLGAFQQFEAMAKRKPTAKRLEADIVVNLAGRAAEVLGARIHGFDQTPPDGAFADWQHAYEIAEFMVDHLRLPDSPESVFERGSARADRLIARYWQHADAVARELLERHTLTGKELREVFESVNAKLN